MYFYTMKQTIFKVPQVSNCLKLFEKHFVQAKAVNQLRQIQIMPFTDIVCRNVALMPCLAIETSHF